MKKQLLLIVFILVALMVGVGAWRAQANTDLPDRSRLIRRLRHPSFQKGNGPLSPVDGKRTVPYLEKHTPAVEADIETQTGSGFGTGNYSYWRFGSYVDSISVTPDGNVYGIFDWNAGRFNSRSNTFESVTGGIDMGENNAYQLIRTGGGSLVLVGESQHFGSAGWIEVFDETSLAFVSSTTIVTGVGFDQTPATVASGPGNSLAVGGYSISTTTFVFYPWVRKYSSGLVLQNQSSLSFEGGITDVTTTPDGVVFACGWVEEEGNDNIWIGKFDSNLNLLKEKTIDTAGGNADFPRALTVDSNGSVYVAGSIYEVTGGTNAWIGRFNQNLNLENSVTSVGTLDGKDDSYDDIVVAGNRVYVTGVQGSEFKILSDNPRRTGDMDMVMASYTKGLSLTSENILKGEAGLNDVGFSLAHDGNGRLYVAGYLEDSTTTFVSGGTTYVYGESVGWVSQHNINLSSSSSTEKPQAFPNPFRPSQGHTTMTIGNMSPNQTVKLFTLKGELVRSIPTTSGGEAIWDLKNDSGESVRSGVYFGVVDGSGSDKTFKVVIQR